MSREATAARCPVRLAWSGLEDAALEPAIRAQGLTLTASEARRLVSLIDRDPTPVEARLFDILWSEHCSYKSSRPHPQALSHPGPEVILGPGEDAGIVHLGHACRRAMGGGHRPREPQPPLAGAAGRGRRDRHRRHRARRLLHGGGGGGGARRAALRRSAGGRRRCGSGTSPRAWCRGSWSTGTRSACRTSAATSSSIHRFDDNCLVNVVAVGVCPEARIIRSRVPEAARSEPYVLILVGKPTDMTGFGGASFASAGLDAERAHEQKGAVQVHDPFFKRVLFEASEAVFRAGRGARRRDRLQGSGRGRVRLRGGRAGGRRRHGDGRRSLGGPASTTPVILPKSSPAPRPRSGLRWSRRRRSRPTSCASTTRSSSCPRSIPGRRRRWWGRCSPRIDSSFAIAGRGSRISRRRW